MRRLVESGFSLTETDVVYLIFALATKRSLLRTHLDEFRYLLTCDIPLDPFKLKH